MKVRTLIKFRDLKANKVRNPGETFGVTHERYKKINGTSHGALVERVTETNKTKSGVKENE